LSRRNPQEDKRFWLTAAEVALVALVILVWTAFCSGAPISPRACVIVSAIGLSPLVVALVRKLRRWSSYYH